MGRLGHEGAYDGHLRLAHLLLELGDVVQEAFGHA
jgi:hypothetical protein